MRPVLFKGLGLATGVLGALVACYVLFWLWNDVTGTVIDGLDPDRPGHMICLNPPLYALILPTVLAGAFLAFSRRLFRICREQELRIAEAESARAATKAVLSRWD